MIKDKKTLTFLTVAFVTAVFSFILSGVLFKTPPHNLKVTTADKVDTSFPDIKNDPAYNTIFNGNALDPAQPLQIGSTQNTQPFNGGP